MRRRAKENPPTTTGWLILGAGVAVLSVGAYFLLRKGTPAVPGASPPQLTAGGSAVVYTDPDTGAQYTRDRVCEIARGDAVEQMWAQLCTQNGGTV